MHIRNLMRRRRADGLKKHLLRMAVVPTATLKWIEYGMYGDRRKMSST